MLDVLQISINMIRHLNIMLSNRKKLIQHVGVQLIIAKEGVERTVSNMLDRDVPRFRRVVAATDRRYSIKCVYAHLRRDFILVAD